MKPASVTSYLTEAAVRIMLEAGVLPPGALQLIVGSTGDLFEHLTCQDVVSFTGSAETAAKLKNPSRDRARRRALCGRAGFA
ncbi:MAG: aldehyde dehydrogenase family protein [Terricaulis sp.]|nr:aldehyde dehydrogenase family protein [Terricaulis sp.]